MGDNHTALGQDQLDVPKTQAEDVVEPDSVADEFGREATTTMRVGLRLHLTVLVQAAHARQGQLR